MISQTIAYESGGYLFKFPVERLAGSYTIYTNYSNGPEEPLSKSFALKSKIPTMTVTKNGIDVSKMSQLTSGDPLNITLSRFDLESDYPGLVIVGQYVGEVLTSAEYMPVNGRSFYFGNEIEREVSVIPNADKIMICYWNKNTYMPLIASYTID